MSQVYRKKSSVAVLAEAPALLREADRCVMCGLCSAHCPTYALERNEAESPRGRVSLIQALLREEVAPGPGVTRHLESCLSCRSCERVCPSGVPYGRLIDAARAHLEAGAASRRPPFLAALVGRKFLTGAAGRLLRLYQMSGLRRIVRVSGLAAGLGLKRWERLLPNVPRQRRWKAFYPPLAERQGEVALFTGCVASIFDTQTLDAAIRLLTRCGYGVHVPRQQGCCGAMHLHNGDPGAAASLAAVNVRAFAGRDLEAVVSAASGCGAVLSEYDRLPGLPDIEGAQAVAARHADINAFLAAAPLFSELAFRPLQKCIAIHTPCTLRNVLRAEAYPEALLGRIPALEVVRLPDMPRCCGAAGTHMLTQPATADALRDELLVNLEGVDVLATSNIGCALHLAAGLREKGLDIEVVHPLVLLAQQLEQR